MKRKSEKLMLIRNAFDVTDNESGLLGENTL